MGSQLKDPCAFPQFAIKAPAISQDAFPSGGSRGGALESLDLPLILGKKKKKRQKREKPAGRVNQPPPPPLIAQGLDPPLWADNTFKLKY